MINVTVGFATELGSLRWSQTLSMDSASKKLIFKKMRFKNALGAMIPLIFINSNSATFAYSPSDTPSRKNKMRCGKFFLFFSPN